MQAYFEIDMGHNCYVCSQLDTLWTRNYSLKLSRFRESFWRFFNFVILVVKSPKLLSSFVLTLFDEIWDEDDFTLLQINLIIKHKIIILHFVFDIQFSQRSELSYIIGHVLKFIFGIYAKNSINFESFHIYSRFKLE